MPTDRSQSVEAIIARLLAEKKRKERSRIKAGEQAAVATGGAVPASDLDAWKIFMKQIRYVQAGFSPKSIFLLRAQHTPNAGPAILGKESKTSDSESNRLMMMGRYRPWSLSRPRYY